MYIEQFFVDGLGCASYLVGCESAGVAAVVDPDRDVQRYLDAAAARNLKITHIIETHLHADHVSGNTDLAARTGATIYVHKDANAGFPHEPLQEGDVLTLGAVQLKVQHTPGHTPESISLLVVDTTRGEQPWMALTGDTLFVGDVGRPDLVGPQAAHDLAGKLYDSLFEGLLKQDDGLLIYPGHGAGSLCGRSIGSVRSTTLGFERHTNPALAAREKSEFVEYMTHDLPEQPGNHQRIKAMNRQGVKPLGEITPMPLTVRAAVPYFRQGAALLDTRSKEEYVKLHVPGSVHLEANKDLSNRAGFVLEPDEPIILMVANEDVYRQVVLALARVGYDNVVGYLVEGMRGWEAARLPVASGDIQDISPQDLSKMLANGKPVVVDVRETWEYAQGHVPGAIPIPLGQLHSQVSRLDPKQPVAVICAHGNRSQSAAALLGQKGFEKVYNVVGGTAAWEMARLPLSRNTN